MEVGRRERQLGLQDSSGPALGEVRIPLCSHREAAEGGGGKP